MKCLTRICFVVVALLYLGSNDARANMLLDFFEKTIDAGPDIDWPPKLNQPYPDLELIDHRGKKITLSSFRGKVVIVEPIGMNCPACNAFSGANKKGGFQGNSVQQNLQSIEKLLPKYAKGITLNDSRIVFVQLLLYDMQMKAPNAKHAQLWANHFGYTRKPNVYVTVPTSDMRNEASYNLIPGFQLIDKDFILRSDSTGHHPKHNLYNKLLPLIPTLIQGN